ncbi:hypothetical protein ONS95_014574 [Cadophora gregata]|uniref:uncharacterized protein n=1 Tax=Cadophora gregata TaxID=51156 RepID=UPI0026DB80D8|nr:uncharacterized protein ONS95_014574 [Cadophora gregata]KAK0112849.1 hypothetical protein ONS95_014574 [Cadophora gregata]
MHSCATTIPDSDEGEPVQIGKSQCLPLPLLSASSLPVHLNSTLPNVSSDPIVSRPLSLRLYTDGHIRSCNQAQPKAGSQIRGPTVKMPKNMINLNSLPLGDMPDGGLTTRPGDNITIRDRVIIYETIENGKKVVKLYRQDNRPQQIQPVAQQQSEKQNRKRAATPDTDRLVRKRPKPSRGSGSQLTAEQERRRMEINTESKRLGVENAAVSQEYAAIKLLKHLNPLNPEVARRTALNKARATDINRRGKENGDRRRALKLELDPESGGKREDEQKRAYLSDTKAHEKDFEYFDSCSNSSRISNNTTLTNEHNSNPSIFRYNATSMDSTTAVQDRFRQSYASAPGCPTHPSSFQTKLIEYATPNRTALPENKIHPARLSLMKSDFQTPVYTSTEPKVLMKVTGENMVPIARPRIADRQAKVPLKHEAGAPKSETIHEGASSHIDQYVKSQEPHRDAPPIGQQSLVISSLLDEQIERFNPDDAVAWLDANISLKGESSFDTNVLAQVHGLPASGRQTIQEVLKPRCVETRSTEQAHGINIITKLGLQPYYGGEEFAYDCGNFKLSPSPNVPNIHPNDIKIKKEAIDPHASEEDRDVYVPIQRDLILGYDRELEESHGGNMAIKQEPHPEHQHAATRIQIENVAIKMEPDEDEEALSCIGAYVEPKKVAEYIDAPSPRRQVLGERSINTITIPQDETVQEMD